MTLASNLEPVSTPLPPTMKFCTESFAEDLEMLAAQVRALPVPASKPSVYDPQSEIVHVLSAQIRTIEAIADALRDTCERCADDCEAYLRGSVEIEDYDVVLAGFEDFLAGLKASVERAEEV